MRRLIATTIAALFTAAAVLFTAAVLHVIGQMGIASPTFDLSWHCFWASGAAVLLGVIVATSTDTLP